MDTLKLQSELFEYQTFIWNFWTSFRVYKCSNRGFPFKRCILNLLNFSNYSATSICKYVLQILISTGRLRFCAQVYISLLTQVHKSYLYLLKSNTNNLKNLTNLTNREKEKLD